MTASSDSSWLIRLSRLALCSTLEVLCVGAAGVLDPDFEVLDLGATAGVAAASILRSCLRAMLIAVRIERW